MATTRAQRAHECDLILGVLLEKLSARPDLAVDYVEYDEGDAAPQHVPDIILRHTRSDRLVRICAIETRSSMTPPRSDRLRELGAQAPLTVMVPKGEGSEAERLLQPTDARIIEYERAPNGVVVFSPGI